MHLWTSETFWRIDKLHLCRDKHVQGGLSAHFMVVPLSGRAVAKKNWLNAPFYVTVCMCSHICMLACINAFWNVKILPCNSGRTDVNIIVARNPSWFTSIFHLSSKRWSRDKVRLSVSLGISGHAWIQISHDFAIIPAAWLHLQPNFRSAPWPCRRVGVAQNRGVASPQVAGYVGS